MLALPASAHRHEEPATGTGTTGNVDAVVSLDGWGGASNSPPCTRCCVYQDERYSEGALLKVEGELLQCARDPQVVGTNDLIWQRVK
ncbi:DUF1496 domain-containing protein [Nissabacter sp. SGAir0207]|nr:DUF1496 domain-containing protein [Nissabacter sp. SGAir0207]